MADSDDIPIPAAEYIANVNVADEIKNSFLDYSMSVIVSRALPDARDGLKPSQRRILLAMNDLSLYPGRQHRKCAKICGDTSGNYHPHGEGVVYPTLVHMAQPWAMRERLVDGQGNFGSVEGDPPAAMRYTEARMTHLGAVLLRDMEKDTVDFVPNYDETQTEPVVLPAAFPNLLVNGGTGIAVGMATNIPTHNLGEIIDAVCAQIENPHITTEELMAFVKGPDFPTGCIVCGISGIKDYFETGRGSVKVRGRIGIEEAKSGREFLVATEIPYGVNRAHLVQRIAELANEKIIPEVTAVRDESDENSRVVIELRRDANPKVALNKLYKHTQLETSFSVNMLALDHKRPKVLCLKDLINCYIEHRREVVLRRTRYELRKAEDRAEVLEGYLIALANLDEFIRVIRESKNREEAKTRLLAFDFSREQVETLGILIRSEARLADGRYNFSERQTDSILDLQLYRLTGMERDKIKGEYDDLLEKIKDFLDILARESRVFGIIKGELNEIREKHAGPRLTEIIPDEGEIAIEDLIANEPVIITITHSGLIKRTNLSVYRAQRRGGKGVIGMNTKQSSYAAEGDKSDFIEHLFTASTHDYLMFFTNTGRVYVERVHEIPDLGRAAKGRSIANLLELQKGERIAALKRIVLTAEDGEDVTWRQEGFILCATRKGTVKKTKLADYANYRRGGLIAIKINEGDDLIDVKLTSGNDEIVLITKDGKSIRFPESGVRSMGRATAGVRGIRLAKGDEVVAQAIVQSEATLLVAGENGIGKRTNFEDYRVQSRGGKGIITMKMTAKTGGIVGALTVADDDEIMLITESGILVRTSVNQIRETGRNTQGVKLINLGEKDKLQAIAQVIDEDEPDKELDDEEQEAAPGESEDGEETPEAGETPVEEAEPAGESGESEE